MPLTGNQKDPDILVLGEVPSLEEDRARLAFHGSNGRLLRSLIPGRAQNRVAYQNAVRCYPYTSGAPSAQAVHACSEHLEREVLVHDFKAILGVGSVPLQRFFPGAQISRVHGARFAVEIGGKLLWYWPIFHPAFVAQAGGKAGAERSHYYPVMRANIRQFFQQVDKWKAPTIQKPDPSSVIIPTSEQEARDLIKRMKGPLGFDIETGTEKAAVLRPYKHGARIVTAAFSDGDLTIAFPVLHPEGPTSWGLRLVLEICAQRPWIAHNAAFELIWLLYFGRQFDPNYETARFDDSQGLARVFHERNSIVSLDDVARVHLGSDVKSATGVEARRIMDYPLAQVLPYNGIDAWASARIFQGLHSRIPHRDTYEHFLQTIRSTTEMELAGLVVDLSVTATMKQAWHDQLLRAKEQAKTIYEVRQYELDRQVEFNIGAAEQVGEALVTYGRVPLTKTPSGEYSTAEEDLRNLAGDNPLALATLAYREAQKMESTYFDATIKGCEENVDGILHPQYTVMLTHTTRLSSIDPNIQNWPKRKHREVRNQIVAPPGHVLVAMDEKQLEARVFGMISKDKMLASSIISGEDIHSYWLHRVLDLYPEYVVRLMEKTNEQQEAKAIKAGRDIIKTDFVFASFFGSIARSCAERTGLPLGIVESVLHEFWGRYDGARRWGQNQRTIYQDTGSTQLMSGFTRHGPMPGNEPYNTPVQGTGARLVLEAQNALDQLAREHKDPYLRARINIHDDLTFILPEHPDVLEVYIETIVPELIKVRFPWQTIPLAVEVKMGPSWANLEYVADFTGDYVR